MDPFTPGPDRLMKFLCLTLAVLLLATAMACIFFGAIFLAVCSAVVSAYAWLLFFDALKAEIVEQVRGRRDDPPPH